MLWDGSNRCFQEEARRDLADEQKLRKEATSLLGAQLKARGEGHLGFFVAVRLQENFPT